MNTPDGDISRVSAGGKVGLIAAWGHYPIRVAEKLRAMGYRTYCLGCKDHADPKLADICHDFQWLGLSKMGGAIRYFRRHGVTEATMAGKFHKVMLYQPWLWVRHLPDLCAVQTFYHHFATRTKDHKDDTFLRTIVDRFAESGVTFRPATDFLPELLVVEGQLTRRAASPVQQIDIQFGWQLAKAMGGLDVGQSVVVKDQSVVAVEAIEGTDACIERAGELCGRRPFTLVKVAKPQQDMRFDVPTIGPGTINTMVKAGGRVIAIEAGRTIVLDEPEVIRLADRHKLAIVAYRDEAMQQVADAA